MIAPLALLNIFRRGHGLGNWVDPLGRLDWVALGNIAGPSNLLTNSYTKAANEVMKPRWWHESVFVTLSSKVFYTTKSDIIEVSLIRRNV